MSNEKIKTKKPYAKTEKDAAEKKAVNKPQKNTAPALDVPATSSEETFFMKIKEEFISEGDKARDIMTTVRDYLKSNEDYHRRVKADKPLFGIWKGEEGEEDKKINVNTIGKYMFGVPNFPSKVKFIWGKTTGVGFLKVPVNMPKECIDLLNLIADLADEDDEDLKKD